MIERGRFANASMRAPSTSSSRSSNGPPGPVSVSRAVLEMASEGQTSVVTQVDAARARSPLSRITSFESSGLKPKFSRSLM